MKQENVKNYVLLECNKTEDGGSDFGGGRDRYDNVNGDNQRAFVKPESVHADPLSVLIAAFKILGDKGGYGVSLGDKAVKGDLVIRPNWGAKDMIAFKVISDTFALLTPCLIITPPRPSKAKKSDMNIWWDELREHLDRRPSC